jgi:hypothetical protein
LKIEDRLEDWQSSILDPFILNPTSRLARCNAGCVRVRHSRMLLAGIQAKIGTGLSLDSFRVILSAVAHRAAGGVALASDEVLAFFENLSGALATFVDTVTEAVRYLASSR